MKKANKNQTNALLIILLAILVFAYKMMFMSDAELATFGDQDVAAARVEAELRQIESITFDTSVLEDPKFQSLKNIEMPLINLPVGKSNPFTAVPNVQ